MKPGWNFHFNSNYMEKVDRKKHEIQSYLKERINPIFEPLTVALIKARPENIIEFCITWLKTFSNP